MPNSPDIGKSSTELESTRALGDEQSAPVGDPTQPLDTNPPDAEAGDPAGDVTGGVSSTHVDKMLGEFRLLRKLGRGGMADVYLAEQTSLKRNVAIKILREDLVADETYLKRFKTEAMAAAGLNHPNIVQVYAIGAAEGIHYIAQEYVQGLNLRELIVRHGPPDVPFAVAVMTQVASALEAAGEAGIIHRDIKPENILITRKGEAKVADFGLAQLTLGDERTNLTQVGITMGTPLYMSPEQVNGHKLDIRSDLYSFGVTCYHMLAGQPPFRGETALSVAVQHLNMRPAALEDVRPDLPDALCKIVHKMMAKNREQRYADATAVLADLSRLGKSLAGKATAKGTEAPAFDLSDLGGPTTFRRFARRMLRSGSFGKSSRQAAAFLGATLAVGCCSAAVGWMLRTENPFDVAVSPASTKILKQKTARDQVTLAADVLQSEEAWQAVLDNWQGPNDLYERRQAHEQLGMLRLQDRRFDEATLDFQELAGSLDSPEWRAKGLANLAIVASLEGDTERFKELVGGELYQMQDHWREYLGFNLSQRLGSAIKRHTNSVDEQQQKDYEKLLDESLNGDESPDGPAPAN